MREIVVFAICFGLTFLTVASRNTIYFGSSPVFAQSGDLNCNFRWRVRNPERTDKVHKGRISIKKDRACTTRHIGWVGGNWQYDGISIKSQPENGKLTKVGSLGIRYVPNAGFTGRDTADLIVRFKDVQSGQVFPNLVRIDLKVR